MIAKYVLTSEYEIFIFSANCSHTTFAHTKPISAGFIRFMTRDNKVTCECFGESQSLNLKSNPEIDTKIAKKFLLCDTCMNCGNCEGRCKKYDYELK